MFYFFPHNIVLTIISTWMNFFFDFDNIDKEGNHKNDFLINGNKIEVDT